MLRTYPKTPAELQQWQLRLLQQMLRAVLPTNRFYREKFRAAGCRTIPATWPEFFAQVPFTTKAELAEDQAAHPPYGTNLTYPLNSYTRFNQTSATTGQPLRWLDTPESWVWMLENWETVYQYAGVSAKDRIFFAFSFGPFLGFWTAFEAATRMGCLAIPGGGMSSLARLQAVLDNAVTVVCCTPTYAIRLGEVAQSERMDLSAGTVRTIMVAGEPGGSIPAVYQRIEELWPGARVRDHHGMTEVGPVSYEDPQRRGCLRIIGRAFIAEVIDPETGQPLPEGKPGELVLTNLGRWGSPLIRYRTGDLVRLRPQEEDANPDVALDGGILGRSDDMVTVRGVNVYPGAVEGIVRPFAQIAEYRVEIYRERGMEEMKLQIEPVAACANPRELGEQVAQALRAALALRVPVETVAPGTLPRFEMKAKRWCKVFAEP